MNKYYNCIANTVYEFSGRKTAPSGALENANPDDGKQQSGFAETP